MTLWPICYGKMEMGWDQLDAGALKVKLEFILPLEWIPMVPETS